MKTVNDYEAERVMLILEFRFCTVSRDGPVARHSRCEDGFPTGGTACLNRREVTERDSVLSLPEDICFNVCVCMCAHLEFICSRRVGFEHYESGQAKKR